MPSKSSQLSLTVHGAGRTVTGACFELRAPETALLVDCGMFQGSRTLEALNHAPFGFAAEDLHGVLLTHAHLDHSGLLPKLAKAGFRGSIWCTTPTADLLEPLLLDAAHIAEHDAERRNRRPDRADQPPIEPLYRADDVKRALQRVRTVPLDTWFEPALGTRARLFPAGHILGSASAEVEIDGARLLFSGDLGPAEPALVGPAKAPAGIDHLICEATYGNRERDDVSPDARRAALAKEVNNALERGGNLLIPAFALERTQELLVDIRELIETGKLPNVTVFIDSPLATKLTEVFQRYAQRPGGVDGEMDHAAFHFVEDVAASRAIAKVSGAIIIAGSGMCEGGRMRHHLLANLARSNATVLFVGFQAKGTLGRAILDGAKRVRISGEDVAVRAAIRSLDCYSAHADRSELLAWIRARKPIAGSLFLVHGEEEGMAELAASLEPEIASILRPQIGDTFALDAERPARRTIAGQPAINAAVGEDWQNAYARFEVNLKRDLQRLGSDRKRLEAIATMRTILDRAGARRR